MGKKAGGATKMTMSELNQKFGGDGIGGSMPTHSEGKEFGKSKGKGLRDFEDSRAEQNEWRSSGKGEGGKGGFRRDRDEPSRADTGDWHDRSSFSRGGGGDRDRGDRGGDRDRDDRGGGRFGGGRGGNRGGDPDAAAEKDGDWRSGPRRGNDDDRDDRGDRGERRMGGGFNRDRDRNRDDDGPSDWRGGGRDRDNRNREEQSERPRLALKPRSKPMPGDDGRAGDAQARQSTPPWKKKKADDDEDGPRRRGDDRSGDSSSDEKKPQAAPAAGKYVPPSLRKKMEESNREPERRRDDDDRRRRRDDEDDRRPERRKDDRDNQDADGFEMVSRPKTDKAPAGAASAGGRYVPAHLRKQQEEDARKQAEAEKKAREEEENRKRIEREKEEAEKARQKAKKEQKQAEKAAQKVQKETKSSASATTAPAKAEEKKEPDMEKLSEWTDRCNAVVNDSSANVKGLEKEVGSLLTKTELCTVLPVSRLLLPLIRYCRRKTEDDVFKAVARFAPVFNSLIEKSEVRRFKVKVLCEAQKIIYEMGLPRLSPASALIETFFDALYRAEIIEEQYFDWWAIFNDDTPGKNTAMFQVNVFLDWLRDARVEGEEYSDSEDNEDGGEAAEDQESEEDSDADIEANVPKRAGRGPPR